MECRSENVTQGLSLTGLYFIMCLHQAWRAARNFGWAGLGSPRQGIHRGCCSLHGKWALRGASSLPLDLPPPHCSHLPKWHQLFHPIRRSQDNFSISYNKQAPHGYVCFCSWQNNTGISPYYWLLLMACHGSPSFGACFPTWPAEMQNVLV